MSRSAAALDVRQSSALSIRDAGVLACFMLSGFVGLVYEIAWIRKASLVFGSATFALSTVLAVFFAGWALGSYVFGGYCGKTDRPLRTYALLEIGLGLLALASPAAFYLADKAYGLFYPAIEHSFAILSSVRFCLVSLLLLPPTVLMGGTLPLLCRQYVARRERIALGIGFLYAINTLGAAVGCYACGFFLIPNLGVNRAIYLGAALNLLIGLVVLRMRLAARTPLGPPLRARDERAPEAPRGRVAAGAGPIPARDRYFTYALFFACGFLVLANEVLWARYLSLLINNTTHTYTLTLTIVLLGITGGSILSAGFFDQSERRALYFGLVQILSGLTVLALLMLPPAFWRELTALATLRDRVFILALVLLPPAVLAGVTFPLAIRMVVDEPRLAGLGVGWMTALNTLGGVFGSLAAGFLALPFLGLHRSVLIATGASLLTGFSAWLVLERRTAFPVKTALAVIALAAWLAFPRVTGTRLPDDFLAPRAKLVDVSEGWGAHLAVVRGKHNGLVLEINRLYQGVDRKTQQIMAAHVPMLLHPNPKRVLNIGLGTGQTGSRFLMYDIDQLDCVEIEGRLFDLVRKHYDSAWLDDARVRVIVEDGRSYISHTDATYDIVSVEAGQTFRPGVASFYTADFYHQARQRLRAGGLLAQFVSISFLDPEEFRGIIRTFLVSFPQSVLWYNTREMLLIGMVSDEFSLPLRRLDLLTSSAALHQDMQYAYRNGGSAYWLNQPEVFLAGFLLGPSGLAALADEAPVFRDDPPRLEYRMADPHEKGFDTQIIRLIHSRLQPVYPLLDGELAPNQRRRIEQVRRKNLNAIAGRWLEDRSR